MRQRVMIAIALACQPKLLIADEPTTALDVTIQAQILALVRELQAQMGMAVLLITHDMGVVARTSQRVAVMYAGYIVEAAPTRRLFSTPRHPYTLGLLSSTPRIDRPIDALQPIPGSPPDPTRALGGCPFAPRCARRLPICDTVMPDLAPLDDEAYLVACHNPIPLRSAPATAA
jgi:oligopeptide/dipeptide ABC transporter ATP-binding protein